jgi:hypothetical protein
MRLDQVLGSAGVTASGRRGCRAALGRLRCPAPSRTKSALVPTFAPTLVQASAADWILSAGRSGRDITARLARRTPPERVTTESCATKGCHDLPILVFSHALLTLTY